MQEILNVLSKVKNGTNSIAYLLDSQRNVILDIISEAIDKNRNIILNSNKIDVDNAIKAKTATSFVDRLTLTDNRIDDMVNGLIKLKSIHSPIGNIIDEWDTKSKLHIKKVTAPLGVFCIIYEARPNVTVDTIGLAIKSGNGIVLRGSKDAINSNKAICDIIKSRLEEKKINSDFIGLITDTTHEGVNFLMKQRDFINVIIPRGGKNLIKNVINNSLIPTIETGIGNCHIYINKFANIDTAKKITTSAKISRVSTCNSAESLLIDREIAKDYLPIIIEDLLKNNVEVRGNKEVKNICPQINDAITEDYYSEYNALIMSIKIVENIDEAISWINEHSTHHSESIITDNQDEKAKFFEQIDSACVFCNTSTRFSDGFQFGFGAEVGISTQKLHARGPMGIKELTTYKYVIDSNGEIR